MIDLAETPNKKKPEPRQDKAERQAPVKHVKLKRTTSEWQALVWEGHQTKWLWTYYQTW